MVHGAETIALGSRTELMPFTVPEAKKEPASQEAAEAVRLLRIV
jgi:hypothetical protein